MTKKLIVREGLVLLATCGAVLLLVVLMRLFGLQPMPLIAATPIAIPLYVLVRLACWMVRRSRSRS
jgi:hypothetical protein